MAGSMSPAGRQGERRPARWENAEGVATGRRCAAQHCAAPEVGDRGGARCHPRQGEKRKKESSPRQGAHVTVGQVQCDRKEQVAARCRVHLEAQAGRSQPSAAVLSMLGMHSAHSMHSGGLTAARAHHQPLQRRQAHGRVHAAPVLQGHIITGADELSRGERRETGGGHSGAHAAPVLPGCIATGVDELGTRARQDLGRVCR